MPIVCGNILLYPMWPQRASLPEELLKIFQNRYPVHPTSDNDRMVNGRSPCHFMGTEEEGVLSLTGQ